MPHLGNFASCRHSVSQVSYRTSSSLLCMHLQYVQIYFYSFVYKETSVEQLSLKEDLTSLHTSCTSFCSLPRWVDYVPMSENIMVNGSAVMNCTTVETATTTAATTTAKSSASSSATTGSTTTQTTTSAKYVTINYCLFPLLVGACFFKFWCAI